MPVMLLLLFSIALSIGTGLIVVLIRRARNRPHKHQEKDRSNTPITPAYPASHACFFRRPESWLAVKSRNLLAVKAAVGLQHVKPCSWLQGLAGDERLFIAPPVKGWILIMGSDLPDPSEDIDACFRFILELSRKLGQVQFFTASRILHYHGWVRAEGGRVVRAYTWAGHTLWTQGARTKAEKELELKCYDYAEACEPRPYGAPDAILTNVDKVPLLAARWSLDPGRIDDHFLQTERGLAGEPSHRF